AATAGSRRERPASRLTRGAARGRSQASTSTRSASTAARPVASAFRGLWGPGPSRTVSAGGSGGRSMAGRDTTAMRPQWGRRASTALSARVLPATTTVALARPRRRPPPPARTIPSSVCPFRSRRAGSGGRLWSARSQLGRRLGVGRVPGRAADPAAQLGALGSEGPPAALHAGHDPVVEHPDVGEQHLPASRGQALRRGQALGAHHDAGGVDAQAAVGVVLVPEVIRPRESLRRATGVVHEIAEADEAGVG